jgi:hypothetical protein
MPSGSLRVVLAESRLSETGMVLRSVRAEAGWALELIFVSTQSDLVQALVVHCPEVAILALSLLRPDVLSQHTVLHRANPTIPLILFAEPADKASAVTCLLRELDHQLGDQVVEEMLGELMRFVKRNVRVGYRVAPVCRGQMAVIVATRGESCSEATVNRIRRRLEVYQPFRNPGPSLYLFVRAERVGRVSEIVPAIATLWQKDAGAEDTQLSSSAS